MNKKRIIKDLQRLNKIDLTQLESKKDAMYDLLDKLDLNDKEINDVFTLQTQIKEIRKIVKNRNEIIEEIERRIKRC